MSAEPSQEYSMHCRDTLAEKTVAEFFAGIGLMRMGLEQAGWRVVWANDIDKDKQRMYLGHFSTDSAHFELGDIHLLNVRLIPSVALATASFPCNDLSLAGARGGLDGRHSSAFWGFVEVLKSMKQRKPPLVMLENVPGFLTSDNGCDFRDACLALNGLGYSVDAFIVDALRFVPQSRQRLFLIGIHGPHARAGHVAEQLSFYGECRPNPLAGFILKYEHEIRWAVRPLPPLPQNALRLADILEDLPPDSPYWWNKERADYLLNQMSERHRATAARMVAGKSPSVGTVFRRVRNGRSMAELRTDGVAGCLRTPRGGSGRQILFWAGKGRYRVRLLTPRECARLMGADDYRITVPLNKALFGFGDAVCVPVIRWIAENYLAPVWKDLYEVEKRHQRRTA